MGYCRVFSLGRVGQIGQASSQWTGDLYLPRGCVPWYRPVPSSNGMVHLWFLQNRQVACLMFSHFKPTSSAAIKGLVRRLH